MIVVSDTSPLNYLVLTDLEWILPILFGTVIVPGAVYDELRASSAPEKVKSWVATSPPWIEVQTPPPVSSELLILDAGEREVIALAERLNARLVLLDEARGRQAATQRGLNVAGTLAVLQRAADRGLISLPDAIERLQRTSFRASPKLLESLRQRR